MEWENYILIVVIYESEVQKMYKAIIKKEKHYLTLKNSLKMTSEYLTKLE